MESAIKRYEFGPFSLLPLERLLLRDGEPVKLRPKAFDTLLVLVQNRGRLLDKNELMKLVWGDTIVEEGNLTQNIFKLRKILGESPTDHQYIVTVPLQGYRFVAAVREVADESRARMPESSVGEGAEDITRFRSVAVLPFRPLGPASEEDEYLGVGIADALITKLSNLSHLHVRSTASALKYSGAGSDLLAAGRELGVHAVLDGLIHRAEQHIRVTVQLVSTKDGETLWAGSFDERLTDIFTVYDSISRQVVRALLLSITGEDRLALSKNYTENREAFHAFIKGRYYWNKRTPENLKKAIDYAQQAIAIDPTYTMAYVGLADSNNLLAGHGDRPPNETFRRARAAALRALEIDPGVAEAYASLGFVNYRYEWDWLTAEQNFRRAIEFKPNYPTGHHWLGECLATEGRFEESLTELQQALDLDPLSLPINTDLGQTLYFSRQYDAAIGQLEKTLEMDPTHVRARILLGAAYEQKGLYGAAIAELQRAWELDSANTLALGCLGHAYAVGGRRDEAASVLELFDKLTANRYVSATNIAVVHAGLRDDESTLTWLEQGYENRDVWLVWLGVNPRYDYLRSDPRFIKLLRRVGLSPLGTGSVY